MSLSPPPNESTGRSFEASVVRSGAGPAPTLDFRHGKAIVRFPATLVRPWLEVANLEIAFPEGAHASAAGQGLSAFKTRRGDLVRVDLRVVSRAVATHLLNAPHDDETESTETACPTTLVLGSNGALIESRWRIESREAVISARIGVAAEGASLRLVLSEPALYAWLPVSIFEWTTRLVAPFAAHLTFDGPTSFLLSPLTAAVKALVPRFGFKIPSMTGVLIHRLRRDGADLVIEFCAGASLVPAALFGARAVETPFANPLPQAVDAAIRADPRVQSIHLPESSAAAPFDATRAWLDVAHGGSLAEALRAAERALAIDNTQIWAWNIVALTREQEVDHRGACDAFLRMADLWFARGETSDGRHALLAAARAIRYVQPSKAVEILVRAHRETPQSVSVLLDLLAAARDADDRRTQIRSLEALYALPTRSADDRGRDLVALGEVFLNEGRFENAAEHFSQARAFPAVAPLATWGEARARLGAGDDAAALALLDPLLPVLHRRDEALWLAANMTWVEALEHAGRLPEAFREIEQLIQSQAQGGDGANGASTETLRRGATIAERLGHLRTAKQWLYALIQKCDPQTAGQEWIDAELRLARVLSAEADVAPFGHPDQMEASEEALGAVEKVLAVSPNESAALKLRPRLLRLLGRINEVAEALARSVENDTDDVARAEVLFEAALTVAAARGDERETLRYLTRSLEADPTRREVHEARARLLRQLGEWRSYVSACRDWFRVCDGTQAAVVAHEAAIALAQHLGDSPGAIKMLLEALNSDGRYRAALEMLSNLAMQSGDHALAARALEGLTDVVDAGERPHVITRHAKTLLAMGLADEAATLLANPSVATDPEALEARVRIALGRDDLAVAASTLETLEAVARNATGDAKTAELFLLKSEIHRRTGNTDEAIASCRRALAVYAGVEGGAALLAELLDGRVLAGAHDVDGATTPIAIDRPTPAVTSVVPQDELAVEPSAENEGPAAQLIREASILRQRPGGLADSVTRLEKAVIADPSSAAAWNQLSDALFDSERWGESLAALDRFIAIRSSEGETAAPGSVHVRRGRLLEALGRPADAEPEYRAAVARNDQDAAAIIALARLARDGDRSQEAVDFYGRAATLFQVAERPDAAAEALAQKAEAAVRSDDPKSAIDALELATTLCPADVTLWSPLHALYERTGAWSQLVDTAVRLSGFAKSTRDERDLLFDAGRAALLHQSDDERAFEILHRVFELQPDHPPLILLLGEYHLCGNEPDEAEGFFRRLVNQSALGSPEERILAWRRLGEIADARGNAAAACDAFANALLRPITAPTTDHDFDLQRARALRLAERLGDAATLLVAMSENPPAEEMSAWLRTTAAAVSGRTGALFAPDEIESVVFACATFHARLSALAPNEPLPTAIGDDAATILETFLPASDTAREAVLDIVHAEVAHPTAAPAPERQAHLLLRAARALQSAPDVASPRIFDRFRAWRDDADACLDSADAAHAIPIDVAVRLATAVASFFEFPESDLARATDAWTRAARLASQSALDTAAIDDVFSRAVSLAVATGNPALASELQVARADLHEGRRRAEILVEGADAAQSAGQPTDAVVQLLGKAHEADPTWQDPLARGFALLAAAGAAQRAVEIATLWCELAGPAERVPILRERALLHASALSDPDAAIHDLRAVLAIAPQDIDAHKHLARLALTEGDATTATTSLEAVAALSTDPASVHEARVSLVSAYQTSGRHKEAVQIAFGLVLSNPHDEATLALFLATAGQFSDDANDLGLIDRVLEVIDLPALRARVLSRRGDILLNRLGQREAAERDLLAALRIDPQNDDSARLLRQMKIEQGDRIAAAALLRQEIDATPDASDRAMRLVDLARLSRELGDDMGALESIDEARARLPHDADAWDLRNDILISLGRVDVAEESLRGRIASDDGQGRASPARIQLGDILALRGAHDEAEEHFRAAWKAGHAAAFPSLAALLEKTGRWEDLYEARCRHLDTLTDPADRARAMQAMAELLDDHLNRPQAAVPLYRRIIALDPSNSVVIDRLTALLVRLENWNALTDLKAAVASQATTGADRTAALLDAARFAAESGRREEEAAFLRQVLEHNPLEPQALANLALGKAANGDPEATTLFGRLETVRKLSLAERLSWGSLEEKLGRDGAALVQLELAHAMLDSASPDQQLAFWEASARARLRVGDRAGAVEASRRTVDFLRETDPARAARVLLPVARAHWESGRSSDAVEMFEQAVSLDPTLDDALSALVELHIAGNRGRHALAALERLSQLVDNDVRACAILMRIGEVNHDLLGNLDAAESAYRRSIARSESEWLPHRRLFFVLVEKGDTDAALQAGDEITRRFTADVVDVDFLSAWGELTLKADRFSESQRAFTEVHRLRPGEPKALHMLAEIARRTGETAAAERFLAQALDSGQPDASMSARELLALSRVILAEPENSDRIPRALAALRRAVSLEPILEVELLLGELLANEGTDRDEAVSLFERRLDAIPFDPEAHRRLALLFAGHDLGRAAYHNAVAAFLNPALPTEAPPRGDEIQAVARRVFRDGSIPPILVHPQDRGPATEMLRLAGPYLADLVPNTRTRDIEPYAAPAEVQGVLRAAGIPALAIAITNDPTVRFSFGPTLPPTLVLARAVATAATATDWRFIAGRAAALVSAGGTAIEHLGPRSVEEIIQLICKLCASDVDIVGVDPGRVAHFLKRLKAAVPRAVRKQIAPFAETYVSATEPTNFSTFAFARHATANRVGLALAGDLSSALRIVARLERSVTQLSADSDERRTLLLANEALSDLVKFAGSEDGLQLLRARRT